MSMFGHSGHLQLTKSPQNCTASDRYSAIHRGQVIRKTTVLWEIEQGLFTGFEYTTGLEDKKSLAVFPL